MSAKQKSRTVKLLAGASVLGLALAAAPYALSFDWHGPGIAFKSALADDDHGGDDHGGDDHGGHGGDDHGGDDHGGHGGDDHGGDDRGGDDHSGDDHGAGAESGEHSPGDDSGSGAGSDAIIEAPSGSGS